MPERPETHGETPLLDAVKAATIAYDSLLVKLTSPEPAPIDVPKPREISAGTVDKVQGYLDNTQSNRED